MARKRSAPPSFSSGPGAYEPYTRAAYDTRTVAAAREERKHKRRRRVRVAVALLLAAVVAAGALCAWGRWFAHDDAADFQGSWRSSTGAAVAIDARSMQLADEVAYAYTLDTRAKTVDYSFADVSGHATYRFSTDRSVLVIDETGDAGWLVWLGLVPDPVLQGGAAPEGVSVLYRQ